MQTRSPEVGAISSVRRKRRPPNGRTLARRAPLGQAGANRKFFAGDVCPGVETARARNHGASSRCLNHQAELRSHCVLNAQAHITQLLVVFDRRQQAFEGRERPFEKARDGVWAGVMTVHAIRSAPELHLVDTAYRLNSSEPVAGGSRRTHRKASDPAVRCPGFTGAAARHTMRLRGGQGEAARGIMRPAEPAEASCATSTQLGLVSLTWRVTPRRRRRRPHPPRRARPPSRAASTRGLPRCACRRRWCRSCLARP